MKEKWTPILILAIVVGILIYAIKAPKEVPNPTEIELEARFKEEFVQGCEQDGVSTYAWCSCAWDAIRKEFTLEEISMTGDVEAETEEFSKRMESVTTTHCNDKLTEEMKMKG